MNTLKEVDFSKLEKDIIKVINKVSHIQGSENMDIAIDLLVTSIEFIKRHKLTVESKTSVVHFMEYAHLNH